MMKDPLLAKIMALVEEYASIHHQLLPYRPGVDFIPVTAKLYGVEELKNLVDAGLEFWLTTGRYNQEFERSLSKFFGLKYCLTVNSGSSANLIAMSALTSPRLGERRLSEGDEVITVAAGFPTTINPIFQNQLKPVFIDVEMGSYNIDASLLEGALSSRTRAVSIAHTLGNPFALKEVAEFCKRNDLFLLEDCADALGAKFEGQPVGTFGDTATLSFYPAHHITTGEGGAVLCNNSRIKIAAESFRDWGRDCFCPPGIENTCKKRFDWKLGGLPEGYDHKYIYSHMGYNLKMTDMQAAVGVAQMRRLDEFIEIRRRNFDLMYEMFIELEEYLILPVTDNSAEPSWFGFPLTIRNHERFSRRELLRLYEKRGIGVRLLFGGDITKQPYLADKKILIKSDLTQTTKIMNATYWLGVHPRINEDCINYMFETTSKFFREN